MIERFARIRDIRIIAAAVVLAASYAAPAMGQNNRGDGIPFTFEATAGVEYDSNISVIELDRATSRDDFAITLDAGVGFETDVAQETELDLSYNFSQSLHFDVTDFDIQTHRATASIDHDFGPVSAGLTYIFAHSLLGGDSFLDFQRLTPALSGFLGRSLYWRAAYEYTDKNFKNRVDRDADVNGFGLSAFVFLDGTKTFVSAGYKLELEDAVAPRFDFDGHNLRLALSHDFILAKREVEFDISWRYEKRDYKSITPSIGEVRDDDRNRFEAGLEVPFLDNFFWRIEYELKDFSSNLPAADFTENLGRFEIGAEF